MHHTAVGLGSIRCRRPGGSCESVSVQHRNGLLWSFDVCGKSGCHPRRGHSRNLIPRFYNKRSKYTLYLFPSNCLSDLRSFFFLYHSVCRFVLKQNSENNKIIPRQIPGFIIIKVGCRVLDYTGMLS